MASAALTIYVNGTVTSNFETTPLCSAQHVGYYSNAGTTLYGVNRIGTSPSSGAPSGYMAVNGLAAAAQPSGTVRLTQTIASNQAFLIPSNYTAPQNTTGGALSDANQLRVTLRTLTAPTKTVYTRFRGDQVVPTTNASFIIAAGGGTAAGDATLIVKGTTASYLLKGSSNISIASTGANTKTILVGDTITDSTNGDTTVYYATATTTTLNGTTEVQLPITPPLQKAQVASDVLAVVAANGYTAMVDASHIPAVGIVVEIDVHAASDIQTIAAGALTAGREYDDVAYDYWYTSGAVSISTWGL